MDNLDQNRENEININKYMSRPELNHKIQEMVNRGNKRLVINLDSLRDFNENLARILLRYPLKLIPLFENNLQEQTNEALDDIKQKGQNSIRDNLSIKYRVTFEGTFGKNMISPRGLTSDLVNQLVCIQGIVTRMSIVKPKLIRSVHYCEETKQGSVKEYDDQFSLSQRTNLDANFGSAKVAQYMSNTVPTKDMHGNPLSFEYGLSSFKDFQMLLVQEPPERTPVGQLPRSVEVILEEDLVDKVKPGDRVQIVGVFKCVSSLSTNFSGNFRTVLIASNVQSISSELDVPKITGDDLRHIKEISGRDDVFEVLSNSFSPSIYGQDYIKKAMIMQLLGGVEKNLENGTHLRGDINILLIGDPSTAKSQFLRHMMSIAPNAINTTGRGSSGVGLTAAVVVDKDTGERHLEAGAMVLGDRGIVCIDEFDKMSEVDRVAIHEVMEQQTVTIAKAGIHVSLNARCSVLAAANPIYGEYQKELSAAVNIGLPDSLLSRFDLVFVVLDEKNPELDRKIAERVIRNHMYPLDNTTTMMNMFDEKIIEPDINNDDMNEVQVYEKHNVLIHGNIKKDILTTQFLKKYLYYSKKQSEPILTEEANQYISEAWTKVRSIDDIDWKDTYRAVPITVRTLETLIRLSTSHAKLRLSKVVSKRDCQVAHEMLNFALYHETGKDDSMDVENESDSLDDKKKKKGMIVEEERSQLKKSDKKKIKREEEDSDIDKIFDNPINIGPVTETQKKFIYRIIHENTKKNQNMIMNELWEIVRLNKDSAKHNIKTRSDLLDIVISLDGESKLMYVYDSEQIVLV